MPASVRERSPGAAHLPPPLDAASHEPPATARARRAVEVHVPPSPGRARLVAAYAAATRPAMVAPSAAELAARLGRYRERMSGPYQVRGASVAVPAAFRMVGGMNQASSQKCMAAIAKALGPEAFRAVRVAAAQVTMGKGTPEQVRALTQALIGSPAFAAYAKLPSAQAVRHLMWDFGIGVDCSGYVHHAFLYSRGAGDAAAPSARYGLGAAELSGLQSLPGPHFRRVSPALARPGDVIKLSQGDDGTGHKVIVTARDELTASDPRYAAAAAALGSAPGARLHVVTVASSWGAGGDPERGGVGEATWAYDEGTERWSTLRRLGSGNYMAHPSSKSGPYDHVLDGVFRPRREP